MGFVAVKQKKYDAAAKAYDRGLASGLLAPEQVNDRLRLLAQLYLQTEPKDLAKSGEFGKRWLEATGTRDPAMLGLVGQSAYFSDNFGEAATYMKEAVDDGQGCRPEARGELAADPAELLFQAEERPGHHRGHHRAGALLPPQGALEDADPEHCSPRRPARTGRSSRCSG